MKQERQVVTPYQNSDASQKQQSSNNLQAETVYQARASKDAILEVRSASQAGNAIKSQDSVTNNCHPAENKDAVYVNHSGFVEAEEGYAELTASDCKQESAGDGDNTPMKRGRVFEYN